MASYNKLIDMAGKRVNYWTVIKRGENDKGGKPRWICECICGNRKEISGRLLRNNVVPESCGCVKKKRKEELENTVEYKQNKRIRSIWSSMKERCLNPNSTEYHNYGAKGVTVCDRWLNFENFKEDMFPSYAQFEKEHGLNSATIDRIDFTGNYEPSNCRWQTQLQQARNRSNNVPIIVEDVHYTTISQLAEAYNMNYFTVMARYNRGWRGIELVSRGNLKNDRGYFRVESKGRKSSNKSK